IGTALDAAKTEGDARTPLGSLGRGVVLGLALAFVAIVTSLPPAWRVGICELWGALLYFVLTAGIGAVLGRGWGAGVGEGVSALARRGTIVRPRRRDVAAVLLALAGPVACVAVSVYRFVASPMIFAYDPFVGFFSGTLYDTLIDAGVGIVTYRAGSLA